MNERLKTNPDYEKARASGAPLTDQLAQYAAAMRERNPVVADQYQQLVDRLIAGEAGAEAPCVGDELPNFLLPDENGRLISRDELLEAGPLILSFNRGNWCPFCWLELSALADAYPKVKEGGGAIVSVTPETATFSRLLKARLDLPYPVLSDIDNAYALELGLAIALSGEIRDSFTERGLDIGMFQNSDAWFVPIPATYIVDRAAIIRDAFINADFRIRVGAEELPDRLAALA